MSLIITHGLRHSGTNPTHTAKGLEQLWALELPYRPAFVLVGTGARFREMYGVLWSKWLIGVPMKFSSFCGSADGFDAPDTIVLADGETCKLEDYMGLANTPGFDAWAFVGSQPADTLFLAGGELVTALGIAKPAKGVIYQVDAEARTINLAS